jgi:Holliday junction resolvase
VIVMDRHNLFARGWSHVLSTTNDIEELRTFCRQVGAPLVALQLGNRRWPHLDLKLEPRERALASTDVRVFERTTDMLRFLKSLQLD